jgi:hypothetical protein
LLLGSELSEEAKPISSSAVPPGGGAPQLAGGEPHGLRLRAGADRTERRIGLRFLFAKRTRTNMMGIGYMG